MTVKDEPMPPGRQAANAVAAAPAPGHHQITPGAGQLAIQGSPPALLDAYLPLIKGSRFHELLLTFLAASAGLTPVYDSGNYAGFLSATGGTFPGVRTDTLTADLGAVVSDIRAGSLPQAKAEIALCCMLANAAYESLGMSDSHPKWAVSEIQFLRHVRHAASHNNVWSFDATRPLRLAAAWRGFALDHAALQSLSGKECFKNSLDSADLLRLLLDVEALLK